MASMLRLRSRIADVEKECYRRNRLAEESRPLENAAATRIQSCFRGCRVRAYLRHLHKKATIIQKTWRGFSARARLRQMVKAAYFIMKIHFYDAMAVRIQRSWRGFYVRKYVHNFYDRKRYLEGLAIKNEQVRRSLDELEDSQNRERAWREVRREQAERTHRARQLHHLLSTKSSPGVFNSPYRPEPHEMELLLRATKPLPPARPPPPRLRPHPPGRAPSPPGASGARWIKGAEPCVSPGHRLPPISSKKPQGPFREPEEVWRQRLRSPEFSLRLQTPYSLQEEKSREPWRHQAERSPPDTPFLPFARAHHRGRKYQRLLHGSAPAPPLGYGTKHFREEDTQRLKEQQPFQTVFNTCHVFGRFGRLYSKAGNIV